MVTAKHFFASVLALGLALLSADVAEGYFLASTRGQFPAVHHVTQARPAGTEVMEPHMSLGIKSDKASQHQLDNPIRDPDPYEYQVPTHEREREEEHHPIGQNQPKYPFIHACHERLKKVFGRYTDTWYYDWKLVVGFPLWLSVWVKWLMYGYDEIYYQRALFAFGINIMILHHLQFAATIEIGMIGVSVVLGGQAIFQSVFMCLASDRSNMAELECETLYLDLSLPPEQIVVLFVAQFCVWWFYMTSILHKFDFDHVNYMYWLVAYMTMQMTMIFNRGAESALGKPFPCDEVYHLVTNSGKVKVCEKDQPGAIPFRMSKADLFMRGVFGFWVNAICREIMAYTIPLMLMGFEQPMDFVVYCVGVNFICTVDDMQTKWFDVQTTHHAKVGDKVVARWPDFRKGSSASMVSQKGDDDPWLAGTITAVAADFQSCTISYEDGSTREGIEEHEVYYAPHRPSTWGQGELRGNHMVPEDASPIHFQADAAVSPRKGESASDD